MKNWFGFIIVMFMLILLACVVIAVLYGVTLLVTGRLP